jgi:AraC-like DNA-binding protein
MHAAAYLTAPQARSRLEAVVGDEYDLLFASSWSELDHLIRRVPTELVVVDPVRADTVEVPAVERLRAYYPSLSVVLYMPFSPALADALLRLGNVGVHSAVFFDHEDTPLGLKRAVDEAASCSISEQILSRIFDGLDVNAHEIVNAFRTALHNVDTIRSALEWSRYLGSSHRSFYRAFRSNGLPTPKTCLLWLRLMYAAKLLEDPGYSLYDVVHRLGYSAPSNFWQHVQDTLGLRASELRYAVGFETLLKRFLSEHVSQAEGDAKPATG